MKKLLVIGGGKWQVPIVKKAKEMGLYVVCSNLYENSPAFAFSDENFIADVTDQKLNLEIAKRVAPNSVVTDQSDIAVKTVAYVVEGLKLPGNSYSTAELFTNKKLMRELLNEDHLGFYHPRNLLISELQGSEYNIKEKVGFPAIIKPTSSQSSRGVFKVDDFKDLKRVFHESLSYSNDGYVLIEQYIDGVELTAEGFKPKGSKHETLAISTKEHFEWAPTVASSLFYSQNHSFDIQKLKKINDRIFEKIDFGITHVEYKYYQNKFYLIEAAIRGGGTKISSHIVPLMSGYDINKKYILNALGEPAMFEKTKPSNKSVALCFFDFNPGVVKDVKGLENLSRNQCIVDYDLEFTVGEQIGKAKDDRSRLGYFIAKADSDYELIDVIEKIKATVEVIYE